MRFNVLALKGVTFTPEEKEQTIQKLKEGRCEICGGEFPWNKLDIDHDHETNKIRGVLCRHCNYLLGNARENPTILTKAISYLEEYKP